MQKFRIPKLSDVYHERSVQLSLFPPHLWKEANSIKLLAPNYQLKNFTAQRSKHLALSPAPPCFSMFHAEKQEGLGDVTCVTFRPNQLDLLFHEYFVLALFHEYYRPKFCAF